MSYEIIYQYHVFKVDSSQAGDQEPRYVVAVEMGSNNCYVGNKRSRSWNVLAVGTHIEVLRQVVRMASSCEGGMLKPGGKDCTPEALISKFRRLLALATVDDNGDGWWTPLVTTADQAMQERATALGAKLSEDTFCGQPRVKADFGESLKGYFKFVTAHHMDLYGWHLCRVGGLRAS